MSIRSEICCFSHGYQLVILSIVLITVNSEYRWIGFYLPSVPNDCLNCFMNIRNYLIKCCVLLRRLLLPPPVVVISIMHIILYNTVKCTLNLAFYYAGLLLACWKQFSLKSNDMYQLATMLIVFTKPKGRVLPHDPHLKQGQFLWIVPRFTFYVSGCHMRSGNPSFVELRHLEIEQNSWDTGPRM